VKAPPQNIGTMAGKSTWKSEDGTVEIHSTELLFCDATDLFADLTAVIGPAGAGFARGGAQLGDAIAMFAREVVGGRLVSYLTRVLASTSMVVRGDGAGNYSLGNRAALDKAFTGRQKFVFPAVKLALEVSLSGFFQGFALIGFDPAAMMGRTSSEDSSQSTSATG
jgi:hypothetical protein